MFLLLVIFYITICTTTCVCELKDVTTTFSNYNASKTKNNDEAFNVKMQKIIEKYSNMNIKNDKLTEFLKNKDANEEGGISDDFYFKLQNDIWGITDEDDDTTTNSPFVQYNVRSHKEIKENLSKFAMDRPKRKPNSPKNEFYKMPDIRDNLITEDGLSEKEILNNAYLDKITKNEAGYETRMLGKNGNQKVPESEPYFKDYEIGHAENEKPNQPVEVADYETRFLANYELLPNTADDSPNNSNLDTNELALSVLKRQKDLLVQLLERKETDVTLSRSDIEFDDIINNAATKTTIKAVYALKEGKKRQQPIVIENLIDETRIRNALKNDPLVQRVLKIYKSNNKL